MSTNPGPSGIAAPKRSLWFRLYNGHTSIEFVRRWPRWFAFSGLVILIGLVSLGTRGLNQGIDFKGGTVWQVPAHGKSVGDTRDAIRKFGLSQAKIQTVTTGGKTYTLPEPFFVLATQNPIEHEGTYHLPEAQLDRFMFELTVDYPSKVEEELIVSQTTSAYKAAGENGRHEALNDV